VLSRLQLELWTVLPKCSQSIEVNQLLEYPFLQCLVLQHRSDGSIDS